MRQELDNEPDEDPDAARGKEFGKELDMSLPGGWRRSDTPKAPRYELTRFNP